MLIGKYVYFKILKIQKLTKYKLIESLKVHQIHISL